MIYSLRTSRPILKTVFSDWLGLPGKCTISWCMGWAKRYGQDASTNDWLFMIPGMLLKLRHKAKKQNGRTLGSFSMAPFASSATSPSAWRAAMTAARAVDYLPLKLAPIKSLRDWTLPKWRGGEFRRWLKIPKGDRPDV